MRGFFSNQQQLVNYLDYKKDFFELILIYFLGFYDQKKGGRLARDHRAPKT